MRTGIILTRALIWLAALLCSSVCMAQQASVAKGPVLTFDDTEHDFQSISESGGMARHIFQFKNTGDSALVVTRVSVSCGCTQPDWTREPVLPGQTGNVILAYNPQGRPGSFNKVASVYTNEKRDNNYRHTLVIKGEVVTMPRDPLVALLDTVGGVAFENNLLDYAPYRPAAENNKSFHIKNLNPEAAYFAVEDVPDYMTVKFPDSLQSNWPGKMEIALDGTKLTDKRGRYLESFKVKVNDRNGNTLGTDEIKAAVNYLDDFSKLSTLQFVSAPIAEIVDNVVDVGLVKPAFWGIFGGTAKKQFFIKNRGKSDLKLHTVTCDDNVVHLSQVSEKTVKAGESVPVDITIKANELKGDLVSEIFVVSNDPTAPVRRIKVTAKKGE